MSPQVLLPVNLTEKEAADMDARAQQQGVSCPDLLGYYVRCSAYGIITATEMLPNVGQDGNGQG